jgi:hypothetical protein
MTVRRKGKKVNRRSATTGDDWVFDAGLERPAYRQEPLSGPFSSRREMVMAAGGFIPRQRVAWFDL